MADQTTPSFPTPNAAQAAAPVVPPTKKEKKVKPTNLVISAKKPKLSKAKRRALQEARRASKETVGERGRIQMVTREEEMMHLPHEVVTNQ